jgi:hypothetical protein
MKLKNYYLLLLGLVLSINGLASIRAINIVSTIQNAKSIQTVIVYGYTDSTIIYKLSASKDSSILSCDRRKMTYTTKDIIMQEREVGSVSLGGYWPRIGDEILLVINSGNTFELCARKVGNNYHFWDPQSTPYIQSSFLIKEKSEFKPLDSCRRAKVNQYGYYSCFEGCLINRIYFDTRYINT